MFLKSLDILGFKSFADRTHIEFADGITALLGPNGCGKSNVVDAVKWVLGEQAAKTMRADKMEDIIFNGTETRKPLNVAEVTLTISNEKNLLPLEVSEITIRRRLFRSGESEYYINGQLSKLKDVRELFWDTGVGKAAYSVMEQGKIDQILSSKPEDRRYLFEEAAGITRFKVKRAEAERKLEKTEENMKQVEGILGEVKRKYESLKIQADKTISFRTLKDEVFTYELDIQLLRLKNFIQDRDRRKVELEKITVQRQTISSEIDAINASLTSNMDEMNTLQMQIIEIQKKTITLQAEQNTKKELIKVLLNQQSEMKQKLTSLEGRKRGIEEKIESIQDDIDEQENSAHDLKKRLVEIQKNISTFEEHIATAGNHITENDLRATDFEKQIRQFEEKRSILEGELEAITENIVTELDSKLKDAGYSSSSRKQTFDVVQKVLSQLKILTTGRKNIFTDFSKIRSPAETDIRTFTGTALQSFTELEQLLLQLENAIENYTKSTPSFIDEFLQPEGIITQKRSLDQRIQENKNAIAEKREQVSTLKTENTHLIAKIDEYRKTLESLRVNRAQMEAQIQTAENHIKVIRRELVGQEQTLQDVNDELFHESKRYDEINEQIIDLESEIASIEHQGAKLVTELENLEKDISTRNTDLSSKQQKLKSKHEDLHKTQAQFEKLNLDLVTSETEIKNLKENFSETHSRDLLEFEERMFSIHVPANELRESLSERKQSLKDLGSVNLMAPEEFAEEKERFDFLSAQIADLTKARDDLHRIAEEYRAESTELFLGTFNKIKKNFHNMFRRLFGGGGAQLRFIDPQNILESGIDIFAQPPGKKLENITLLSGGEKTMTAVSLLFATYMVRPSPFCLLDEIDAALDEQNVLRFIQALREFANVSQYIVITHNRKTASGAGTLLGITMEEFGVSKIITIKLASDDNHQSTRLPDIEPFEEEDVSDDQEVYIPPHPPRRTIQ